MDYLCLMDLKEAQQKFIHSWGTLGSSWGINKVMGQIHALLLLSPEALTTDQIMEALQISRGNANMNIRALIGWGIVRKEYMPGSRKEYFTSEKDILELARQVSIERRKREIEPLLKTLKEVQDVSSKDKKELKEFKKVTKDILSFSTKVDKGLLRFIHSEGNWFFRRLMKLIS